MRPERLLVPETLLSMCLPFNRENRSEEGRKKVVDRADVFKYLKSCHMENESHCYLSVPKAPATT